MQPRNTDEKTEAGELEIPAVHLPELVSFDPKTRDVVIGAIKLVLRRLRKEGVFRHEGEYADVLKSPEALFAFIQGFKEHRDLAKDITVDAMGAPVVEDQKPLVCNVTLAQIERLLVYTCAKKRLAQLESIKQGGDEGTGSRELPDATKSLIGFSWQLPLFDTYLDVMSPEHFQVLGPRVLVLRTAAALEPIARLDALALRKAEKIMGADFDDAINRRATAIRGAAACDPKGYAFLKRAAKGFFWNVLSAHPQVVLELSDKSVVRVAALAPYAAKLCQESFEQLEAVPESVITPMMESFRSVFDRLAPELLGEPEFAKKYLFKMVGGMRSFSAAGQEHEAETRQAIRYKWEAESKSILAWWDTLRRR